MCHHQLCQSEPCGLRPYGSVCPNWGRQPSRWGRGWEPSDPPHPFRRPFRSYWPIGLCRPIEPIPSLWGVESSGRGPEEGSEGGAYVWGVYPPTHMRRPNDPTRGLAPRARPLVYNKLMWVFQVENSHRVFTTRGSGRAGWGQLLSCSGSTGPAIWLIQAFKPLTFSWAKSAVLKGS